MGRGSGQRLIALLLGLAALVLPACATPPPAGEPLSSQEREPVKVYLDAVAGVNREAQHRRINLRWWVAGVPGVIWEGRGLLTSNRNDAQEYLEAFLEWRDRVQSIQPVPPAATEAHAALERSYDSTVEMLRVYHGVLEATVQARETRNDPTIRRESEEQLAAARAQADRATAEAHVELEALLNRYQQGA